MKQKKYTYDFQQYETIRSSLEIIYTCEARIVEAQEDQSNLLKIQQNIIITLDQKQKKVRIKKRYL